jgi:tetratricopeptide (TPR) repeat protein
MKEFCIYHIPADDSHSARVRVSYRPGHHSQAQQCEKEFWFHTSDADRALIQWYLEEYLLYPWGEFCHRAEKAEATMNRLGERLFDAVLGASDALDLYREIADDLARTRITIFADDPAGIALPWELLRDRTRGDSGHLARLAFSFVRSHSGPTSAPPLAPTMGTLNILMVISRPAGPEDVPFQSVARPLLDLFRPQAKLIHFEVLRPPTFQRLSQVLSENPGFFHVLHFDGHGSFPKGEKDFYKLTGAQGTLLFETDDGEPHEITGKELSTLLKGKNIRVVLLNACQSGMTHPESLYPSIGNQLLEAGAQGVIAMAYSVYAQTAVSFMYRLYQSLIVGETLARATTVARESLYANSLRSSPVGDIQLRDWVVPIVFESATFRLMAKRSSAQTFRASGPMHNFETYADFPEGPKFGFVGGDGVMLTLERLFRAGGIVVLKGMAGVGKTTLAIEFAKWRASTGAQNGPIFFFSCNNHLTVELICNHVCRQLGEGWDLLSSEQRYAAAQVFLRDMRCFLILDGIDGQLHGQLGEDGKEGIERRLLADFIRGLHGGSTKVLITSRHNEKWLGQICLQLEMNGLNLAESQNLAVAVLRQSGFTADQLRNLPQYNDLLRFLRGIPLAIQIVITELNRSAPLAVLEALRSGDARLAEGNAAGERHRSLFSSLAYQFATLEPAVQRQIRTLALFQGFCDLDVLTAISQQAPDPPQIVRGLDRHGWTRIMMIGANIGFFQHMGSGYYRMHPALPWFFCQFFGNDDAAEKDKLWQTFCLVYGDYGRELSKLSKANTALANFLLRWEEDNITHALMLAKSGKRWNDAGKMLLGLEHIFVSEGRWEEWEALLGKIEVAAMDIEGDPVEGAERLWYSAQAQRAQICHHRGHFEAERELLGRLKEFFTQSGDDVNLRAVISRLGAVALQTDQVGEAERLYEEELKAGMGDLVDGDGYYQLGRLAETKGENSAAKLRFAEALQEYRGMGYSEGVARTLIRLGDIAIAEEEWLAARQAFHDGLIIYESLSDWSGQARACLGLGNLNHEEKHFEEAGQWYRRGLELSRATSDDVTTARLVLNLGVIAYSQIKLDESNGWYQQGFAIAERLGNRDLVAEYLYNMTMCTAANNDLTGAVELCARAKALFLEGESSRLLRKIQGLSETLDVMPQLIEKEIARLSGNETGGDDGF